MLSKTELENRVAELHAALEELLASVTSKGADDTRLPIAWSGSAQQNRRMYAALEQARAALKS